MKLKFYGGTYYFPDWAELTLFGKLLLVIDIPLTFVEALFDYLYRQLVKRAFRLNWHILIYKEEKHP